MGPRLDAQSLTRFFLHPDIDPGGGILPDADEDEPGLDAAGLQRANASGGVRVNLLCNGAPIDKVGKGHYFGGSAGGAISWIVSISMTGVLGQRSSSTSSPVTKTFLPQKFLTRSLVGEL